MPGSRQQGQAVVEFGIIALLFTLLLFAVIDVGLLLNTWLAVSSGSREIARSASVGKRTDFLTNEASNLVVPAVSASGFSGPCCGAGSALHLSVDYFPQCVPSSSCLPLSASQILADYGGSCASGCTHPTAGDYVRVTLAAQGAQVVTPLVRPFFGCRDGTNPRCYVQLSSTTIMRYEGAEF